MRLQLGVLVGQTIVSCGLPYRRHSAESHHPRLLPANMEKGPGRQTTKSDGLPHRSLAGYLCCSLLLLASAAFAQPGQPAPAA